MATVMEVIGGCGGIRGSHYITAMSKVEIRTDRDPKTGQYLPGHTCSNKEARVIAQRMSELKVMWLSCVTLEDVKRCHQEHMRCIIQDDDWKVKLAAIIALRDQVGGKPEQHINVQSENRTLSVSTSYTPEQQQKIDDALAVINGEVRQVPNQTNPE